MYTNNMQYTSSCYNDVSEYYDSDDSNDSNISWCHDCEHLDTPGNPCKCILNMMCDDMKMTYIRYSPVYRNKYANVIQSAWRTYMIIKMIHIEVKDVSIFDVYKEKYNL